MTKAKTSKVKANDSVASTTPAAAASKLSVAKSAKTSVKAAASRTVAAPKPGKIDKIIAIVRRQNIWHSIWAGLVEHRPRLGVDVKRRACGVASVEVRWSVA